jgi:GLPGLI family protein
MKQIILILLIGLHCNAQSITNLEYSITDRNGYECTGTLFIDVSSHLFRINDPRTEKSYNSLINPQDYYRVHNDKWSKIFYFNGKEMITRIPLYGKEQVYLSNEIPKKIKFTNEKKIIGKFNCQGAMVEKGGRKYSVFFTKDYPKQVGPMGFNFLPGLVVEIKDLDDTYNKITLTKISKQAESKTFDTYKKYMLSKKTDTYLNYSKNITKFLTNKKRDNYALLAKYNATVEYAKDESFYTDHLIDIPENLVKELQKIKQ